MREKVNVEFDVEPKKTLAVADGKKTVIDGKKAEKTRADAKNTAKNGTTPESLIKENTKNGISQLTSAPTPQYNATIFQDSLMLSHLNALHALSTPAFAQASILLKIWLHQRGLSSDNYGAGISGFIMVMILAHLITSKKMTGFSAEAMVKVTFDFIATRDFSKPVFLSDGALQAEVYAGFNVAIVDSNGLNLASHLSKGAIMELQHESKLAVQHFTTEDPFTPLFLKKITSPLLQFDNVFRYVYFDCSIPAIDAPVSYNGTDALPAVLVDQLYSYLSRALNIRASLISITAPAMMTWDIESPTPDASTATDFTIGLLLDAEHSLAQVEHGPLASTNSIESLAFKDLWGPKSELRRFKSGEISNVVVFETDGTLEQRSLITARMAAFILSIHFGIGSEAMVIWAGLGSRFLKPAGSVMGVNSYQNLMDAYISLSKILKNMRALPLSVREIQPVSDALRYSSVFVPQNNGNDVMEMQLVFESSGRWPDDIEAIQHMKRAFYIKMAEMLPADTIGTVSTGYGEHPWDFGALEIQHVGYKFRVIIHHDREAHLVRVRASTKDVALKAQRQNEEEIYLEMFHRRPYFSHHMGQLALRFPCMGTTIRLVKRWASAHLLGISEQVLELVCASVYLNSAPFALPGSGFTGFVRALYLMCEWDWSNEPLLVELEKGAFTPELRKQAKDNFNALTKSGTGHIPLFIATERDVESRWWGMDSIHIMLMRRLVVFCKSTLGHLNARMGAGTDHDLAPLFVTPSDGFGALLHLDCGMLPQYVRNITYDPAVGLTMTSKYKNTPSSHDAKLEVLSQFNIVEEYVNDLRRVFRDVGMFFYDRYGGDKVAIVWRPMTEGKMRTHIGYNAKKEGNIIVTNKEAMVGEMVRMGEGLCIAVSME